MRPRRAPARGRAEHGQLDAVEQHRAALDPRPSAAVSAMNAAQRQALARARLADEPERAAGLDVERDAVDRAEACPTARLDAHARGRAPRGGARSLRAQHVGEAVADQREPEAR